jgi:hypothetical protein
MKSMLKAPRTNLLTLKHGEPLSTFAFKSKLRRYTTVGNTRRCSMLAHRLAPLAPPDPSCPAEASIAAAADEAARRKAGGR